ncbi:MAG: HlyD family efflux transporter periplasmic adaptor subunit [Planctomycetaceae bacterium]
MKKTKSNLAHSNGRFTGVLPAPRVFRESAMPSLRLARSSRLARRIARVLIVCLILGVVAMLFAPWQQSVSGKGSVTAFAPEGRQQVVEAPVTGRVVDWDPKVIYEGARVKEGQIILQIRNMDPKYLDKLNDQRAALKDKLGYTEQMVTNYKFLVENLKDVKREVVAAAVERVKEAEQKIEEHKQKIAAATAAEIQADADFKRQKALFEKDLKSEVVMQKAERKWKESVAKLKEAQFALKGAQNSLNAKRKERNAKEKEAQGKIESVTALQRKVQGEVADLKKSISEIDIKIAQQENQDVKAPRDGFILKMMVNQGGEIVKLGDPLFILVPDTTDRAVEIWLSGNDAPLVNPGDHVRLQFEGWPAVQFTGWPSVAVGTFGGKVFSVDATDNGRGQFRILVVPDENEKEWPSDRFLRQGVRANGWVLLKQVSLGYEMWRRMNGFPPVVDTNEPKLKSAPKRNIKKK